MNGVDRRQCVEWLRMLAAETPELLHIVGYITGATLYAMLLAMVARARERADSLALVTAVLGLAWNVGEISVHAADALAFATASSWLAAASYSALGLLAAVVVHSVATRVKGTQDSPSRGFTVAVDHGPRLFLRCRCRRHAFLRCGHGIVLPSSTGLTVVAIGLGALAVPLLLADASPTAWRARAVDDGAGGVRRVRASPRPLPRRQRELDDRAARAPRVDPARVRDPLSGLPLRAGRPVPEAGAHADRAGGRACSPPTRGRAVAPRRRTAARSRCCSPRGWRPPCSFRCCDRAVTWFVDRVVLSRANYGDVLDRPGGAPCRPRDTADDGADDRACAELGACAQRDRGHVGGAVAGDVADARVVRDRRVDRRRAAVRARRRRARRRPAAVVGRRVDARTRGRDSSRGASMRCA